MNQNGNNTPGIGVRSCWEWPPFSDTYDHRNNILGIKMRSNTQKLGAVEDPKDHEKTKERLRERLGAIKLQTSEESPSSSS